MTESDIKKLTEKQRSFFRSGRTLPAKTRLSALKKLEEAVLCHESELLNALKLDLGKSSAESYMCEIGLLLSEIRYLRRHLRRWMKKRQVLTPLSQFCSRSFQKPSPYGVVLIMSPWNYPVLLTLEPLADALAAGNTAVLKPSAYAPHTSRVLEKLIRDSFPSCYVSVVTGGRQENASLLNQRFDYIFFTGGKTVGSLVMRRASEHLTPITLELGGKSPCIVEKTADISVAARRIVFGKFLNCGQTCVAPDYILCDHRIRDDLIRALKKEILRQFGPNPLLNPAYGKIISQKHFHRIARLLSSGTIVHGGQTDEASLKIEPTLLSPAGWNDPVMQEEIFGPLLPVLTYDSLEDAIRIIEERPHPLAFYLFTKDKKLARHILSVCSFGGGCVNDTIIHLATSRMGFGGFGESGMGSYHGKAGFDTFSHQKSIVDKRFHPDLPMRYQPYSAFSEKLIRLFLR